MGMRFNRSGSSNRRHDRRSKRSISVAVTEVLESRCLLSNTVYVDHTATGTDDGSSWANAYTSLQSALTANPSAGTTIDVAAGTYSPGGSATNTFDVPAGVTLSGGFANGGSVSASPSTNVTVLSGGGINNHVVTLNGYAFQNVTPTTLEGFTVTGGNADGGGAANNGGGVLAVSGSGASVEDRSGSIYVDINNCSINGNTATGDGGGIESQAYLTIENSYINGDSAANGGGITDYSGVSTLISCELEGDSASQEGGGIYAAEVINDGIPIYSYAKLNNCDVVGDTADGGQQSGAIAVEQIGTDGGYSTGYVSMYNTIIYGDGPNELITVTGSTKELSPDTYDGIYADFSDVEYEHDLLVNNTGDLTGGTDNAGPNPLFFSNYSNLQLQPDSPDIDAGSTTAVSLGGDTTDLAGHARTINGQIDMGAFEHEASGVPAGLSFAQIPSNTTAGDTLSTVTVDVTDINGAIVTGDDSNVTLSINTGPSGSTLLGTATVAAVNGVATFTGLSLDTAGTFTLTASDTADGIGNATSGTFTIAPASATQLAISTPSSASVGVAISPAVVVDLEDQFGNIVNSNSTDHISVSLASGTGSLSGTTSGTVTNGVATFSNLIIGAGGSYTLEAADTTNNSITSATSGSFNVGAGSAAKLVFTTTSGTATAGVDFSPAIVVDVESAGNSIVTTDNSTVTLTTTGGTFTMQANNGAATFSNVILNTAGSYAFTATDGSLASATSGTFTVAPAAASQLVFTSVPSSATEDDAIAPPVVVKVEDAFGNVVASNDSNVAIANASGTLGGSGTLSGTTTVAAVNGVATFADLSFNATGTYTLAATQGSLTAGTSASITVNPSGPLLTPSKLVFAAQPQSGEVDGSLGTITVYVENKKGQVVTSDQSTVTLAIHSGAKGSVLSGSLTAIAVNGTATFTGLSINDQGAFTLSATDTDNGKKLTAATSKSFKETPVLLFSIEPASPQVAGVVFTPTVVVQLVGVGNVLVPNGSGSIKLSATGGSGKLLGTTTVSAKNGAASFSKISIDAAGTYGLVASASKLTSVTSGTFTVNPSSADKLIFTTQPASETEGTAEGSFAVSVEDKFGNVLTTDDTDVVTLTLSPTATASGTLTAVVANGVATFSNVTVDKTGSFTFKANAPGLAEGASKSFSIKG
jgi:hypothetical protein